MEPCYLCMVLLDRKVQLAKTTLYVALKMLWHTSQNCKGVIENVKCMEMSPSCLSASDSSFASWSIDNLTYCAQLSQLVSSCDDSHCPPPFQLSHYAATQFCCHHQTSWPAVPQPQNALPLPGWQKCGIFLQSSSNMTWLQCTNKAFVTCQVSRHVLIHKALWDKGKEMVKQRE